ncbi:hypothetical protein TorRG33x02_259100 [Trema orientale]|uniref:Uncharacterized protein n=1 Tax=Trema orientale TaxID=63057 RepID=A0A2P5D891_TREOI|nr:hypothetical protein TorRG33x02_259100 [Trema orientale]
MPGLLLSMSVLCWNVQGLGNPCTIIPYVTGSISLPCVLFSFWKLDLLVVWQRGLNPLLVFSTLLLSIVWDVVED